MNTSQLNTANIKNLTALWKVMGSTPCTSHDMENFQQSVSWPHRCWHHFEQAVNEIPTLNHNLKQLSEDCIIPLWKLQDTETEQLEKSLQSNEFTISSEQTAMYLDLNNYPVMKDPSPLIRPIFSPQGVQVWTDIAANSFGYEIDINVIQKILQHPDVHLYIIYEDNRPAATAMLFKTGEVIGLHQLGVLPEFRGKGIARKMMYDLINLCANTSSRYITLQASIAAERLYLQLGFTTQFKITNYQRSNNAVSKEEQTLNYY